MTPAANMLRRMRWTISFEARLGDLAVLYGFFEGLAEVVVVAGHVLVESAEGGR